MNSVEKSYSKAILITVKVRTRAGTLYPTNEAKELPLKSELIAIEKVNTAINPLLLCGLRSRRMSAQLIVRYFCIFTNLLKVFKIQVQLVYFDVACVQRMATRL